MQYPSLNEIPTTRDLINSFGGYNHNLQIGESEFYEMTNMTSDYYPILSPRGRRGVYDYPEGSICNNPKGISQKDALCYIDGTDLFINNRKIENFVSADDEDKTLVSMGAYLIIFPDKKYINTQKHSDRGDLEATHIGTVDLELCSLSGDDYSSAEALDSAPDNPNNLQLWIDTSGETDSLKQWSKTNEQWVTIPTTYIKIKSEGIGSKFSQYDAIAISGFDDNDKQLSILNNTSVIYEVYHDPGEKDKGENIIRAEGTNDYIVIIGILERTRTGIENITFERKVPEMDFIIESGNRLWGCKYGPNANGDVVNEIYASKLGDFKNWNCFMGISTDSYAASLGTDGQFTGAIAHNNYPIFFKENYMHKVYGQYPANYQIQTTPCNGVQKDSYKSLAIVNTILYYKSRKAICAYDGSLPVEIGSEFGNEQYSEAVAGATGNKYYISMKDDAGKYHMFVYDTKLRLWHREDNTRSDGFCLCDGYLYYIDHDSKKIGIINPPQDKQTEGTPDWEVQTGLLGTSLIDNKYISKINVRMSLDVGTRVHFMIQYDSSKEWILLCTVTGHNLRSFTIPLKPRRCDHFRLKISGRGEGKIFSISKTIEQGSDFNE